MDVTDCLGLPFPECEPPLTKDLSDIEQFRDLAVATDAAVQAYADTISEELLNPDAANLLGGINVAGLDVVHFFGPFALVFDNAGMFDPVGGGLRIQEDGWYMVGGHVQASTTPPSTISMRVEPLVNGDPVSSRQGPSFGNFATLTSEAVSWADTLQLRAGDLVNMMTHHAAGAATVVNYNTRIWALQVMTNE